ncbi:MAG: HK97-gp10 family putative phage morphogenesis protein [Betaproteobacteria bacterium]
MTDEFAVKGLDKLNEFLQQLPVKIEKNVLRGALRAGAKVIMARAKQNVPVSPPNSENARLYGGYAGALRDSMKITVRARGGTVTASVKAGGKTKRGGDAFYAHMVEFGTSAHLINGKLGGSLFLGGLFAKQVMHPGARPHPFLRPAMDAAAQPAVIAAAEYMKKRLETKEGLDTSDIVIGDEA